MKIKETKKIILGFTLLETIVAVSILVTAIVGPFTLAQATIRAQQKSKNQLVAANLAQEGLELFRNYRANNILKNANLAGGITGNANWMDGTATCSVPAGCGIDVKNIGNVSLPGCGSINNCFLYLGADNVYSYCVGAGCGTRTKFQRKINLQTLAGSPEEVVVTTTVSWSDTYGNENYSVATHLLNW